MTFRYLNKIRIGNDKRKQNSTGRCLLDIQRFEFAIRLGEDFLIRK